MASEREWCSPSQLLRYFKVLGSCGILFTLHFEVHVHGRWAEFYLAQIKKKCTLRLLPKWMTA